MIVYQGSIHRPWSWQVLIWSHCRLPQPTPSYGDDGEQCFQGSLPCSAQLGRNVKGPPKFPHHMVSLQLGPILALYDEEDVYHEGHGWKLPRSHGAFNPALHVFVCLLCGHRQERLASWVSEMPIDCTQPYFRSSLGTWNVSKTACTRDLGQALGCWK